MITIDAHQHFWKLERADYHWLTEDLAEIYRDFSPEDFAPILVKADVAKTVLVQAAATLQETEYLLSLADENDFIAGVVGWVDMELGDSAVDILLKLSKQPKLCAIRPMIHEIADPNWMLKPEIELAINTLSELDLCFDALVRPEHLSNLLVFQKKYPELKVVIDHGAKPDIAGGDVWEWKRQMKAIADETQAFCKLSGLLTEAKESACYGDIEPYMEFLLEIFGADRLMWGSDWPVLNSVSNYSSWILIARQFVSGLTNYEQGRIMGETARQFYTLPD